MDDMSLGGLSRNPPVKPKRNNAPSIIDNDESFSDHEYSSPMRRARQHRQDSPPTTPNYGVSARTKVPIVDAEPETTIGVAVKMKGELSFERLLRIEGEFEGKLVSKGSLVIGSKGALIGNVENMKEVYITGGKLIGNVSVERLVLRDKAQVFGNITAKTIKIEPDCVVIGKLNVNPQAPEKINEKGEIVKDASKPAPAPAPTPAPK